MLWWLFVIAFFLTLFLCNRQRISVWRSRFDTWRVTRDQISWTTYYNQTLNCSYIHLVPLDSRDGTDSEHSIQDNGDCRCAPKKELYDNYTVVYRHEKLRQSIHS